MLRFQGLCTQRTHPPRAEQCSAVQRPAPVCQQNIHPVGVSSDPSNRHLTCITLSHKRPASIFWPKIFLSPWFNQRWSAFKKVAPPTRIKHINTELTCLDTRLRGASFSWRSRGWWAIVCFSCRITLRTPLWTQRRTFPGVFQPNTYQSYPLEPRRNFRTVQSFEIVIALKRTNVYFTANNTVQRKCRQTVNISCMGKPGRSQRRIHSNQVGVWIHWHQKTGQRH